MLSAEVRDLVERHEIRKLPTLIAKRESPGFTELRSVLKLVYWPALNSSRCGTKDCGLEARVQSQ